MDKKAQETGGGWGFVVKILLIMVFLVIIIMVLAAYVFPKLTTKGLF